MNMSSFNALVRTLDVKISIRRTQCSGIPFNLCLCDDLPHLRLQAVSLFSWSMEQKVQDTQMTTHVTEGGFSSQRSQSSPH